MSMMHTHSHKSELLIMPLRDKQYTAQVVKYFIKFGHDKMLLPILQSSLVIISKYSFQMKKNMLFFLPEHTLHFLGKCWAFLPWFWWISWNALLKSLPFRFYCCSNSFVECATPLNFINCCSRKKPTFLPRNFSFPKTKRRLASTLPFCQLLPALWVIRANNGQGIN